MELSAQFLAAIDRRFGLDNSRVAVRRDCRIRRPTGKKSFVIAGTGRTGVVHSTVFVFTSAQSRKRVFYSELCSKKVAVHYWAAGYWEFGDHVALRPRRLAANFLAPTHEKLLLALPSPVRNARATSADVACAADRKCAAKFAAWIFRRAMKSVVAKRRAWRFCPSHRYNFDDHYLRAALACVAGEAAGRDRVEFPLGACRQFGRRSASQCGSSAVLDKKNSKAHCDCGRRS